jgi:FtsP/CotA-like multicopper oxidase with cupredoxin domain
VALGETIHLSIDNETIFPHAMHLHGQHFREIMADGRMGPMRDTLLVGGRNNTEIAFVQTIRESGFIIVICWRIRLPE